MNSAPLTEAQEGLWYAQSLDPANPVFNTAQYLELRGALEVEAFTRAVAQAMSEARGLSVSIAEHEDGPRQTDTAPPRLQVVDCRHHATPREWALAEMDRDLRAPIDLARDPLVAQTLFVAGDEIHLWYQRVHHVVIDGYGTSLLTRRICDLYRTAVTGTAAATRPLQDPALAYADDATYRASAQRAADAAFWQGRFDSGLEVVGLAEGTPITAHHYERAGVTLPPDVGAQLVARSDACGISWPDVLVALVGAYVQRHTGRVEAIVGVPAMLRMGSATARVPAMVMNVLPVRIPDAEAQPLAPFLSEVANQLKEARRHGRYRSEQLRRDLGLLGDQRRLYGVLVNVLPFDAAPSLPGLSAQLEVLGTGPVDDLTVTFRAEASGHGLRLEIDANPTLYPADEVAAHAQRLATFVAAALQAQHLSDVPTVSAEETRWLVHEVNATGHAVADVTLTALIEAVMARQPDAPAVEFGGQTLTYADLDRRSACLARHLARAGAGAGEVVGVFLPRSLDLEVALVGTLRAGAAYLPIDLDTPLERIRAITASAQPKALLTVTALAARLPAGLPILLLDALDWHLETTATPPPGSAPGDPAYVIYTSGSTGTPKGVVVDHRAIVNRLEWMRVHYGITARDRILQKTPATFDVSVWEFFLPLIAGGVLVMAPPDAHKDPLWLARLVRDDKITTMHFVPSMLAQFLAEPAARGTTLARVFCSGEALPAALRDRFHAVVNAELHNLYGPTEAAVDVTYWDASRHDHSAIVPIGWPVWNTRMHVLDARRRLVPAGVPGQLYIAGVQLARGYLGRPDLTAERFVPDPFGPAGARMYDTGDVARRRRDGAIEFLGRSDHQVKLRGLRIEPGEIEAALLSADVAQAVVLVREDRPGDPRLVAYLVPHTGRVIAIDAVRAHLEQRVPSYMVPSAFVVLEGLPVSSSGKLERRRLPAPETTAAERPGRAPRTATERRLAALFTDVLGLPPADAARVHAGSDFFALGGHSLLATQVMRAIRLEWSCDLGLGVLFAHPTVEALAAHIDGALSPATGAPRTRADDGLGTLVTLATGTTGATLFCIHPAGGLAWCYGHLARAMTPVHDVCGVQAEGLDLESPLPASLTAMAAGYVDAIQARQPKGPYHLAGWSVGGIIAHAMTAVLEARGEQVRVLAMFDAYPSDRWRDQAPPGDGAALTALLLMAGLEGEAATAATAGAAGAADAVPLTRAAVLKRLRASGHPLGSLSDAVLSGIVRVVGHNSELVRQHHHTPVAAPLLHFRAALDHAGTSLTPADWGPYVTSPIEVHAVPARHPQMVAPEASRAIAAVLQERIRT